MTDPGRLRQPARRLAQHEPAPGGRGSRARGRRGRALWTGASATCRSTTRISKARTSRTPSRRLREDWAAADAILFATPEYNGSVPGGLKNAIDWASRPVRASALTNKTVAVIGASTGQFGAMWAQADLRKILGVAGARVVGDELPVTRAHEKFDAEGRLLDGELFERLRLVLETLARRGGSCRRHRRSLTEKERGRLRGPRFRLPACIGRGASCSG